MTLSTGIDELDRRLDGGLRPGSVVAVLAPPETQWGPLIAAGLDLRPTTYFSTVRTTDAVHETVAKTVNDPDLRLLERVEGADVPDRVAAELPEVPDGSDVVLDATDPVEAAVGRDAYLGMLNDLSGWAHDTDGLAVLTGFKSEEPHENRKYTLAVADVVFDLSVVRHVREAELEYRLTVPKATGHTLTEGERMLDIDLGRDVYVDVSRSI
jgi:hypothetical protein